MIRTLTAAAVLAVFSTFSLSSAVAATAAASAPAKARVAKKAPAKPAAEAPVSGMNDNLNANQLSMADRVLTGVANCEFKEKVDVEKIEGHSGNFKLTYDRKTYIMVPEETTTGAIRLVDTGGAVVWVQIPLKSMLMNQKEHHRMVDNCQEDEQRIAVQSSTQAGANAPFLAPSVATAASAAAARPAGVAVDPPMVTTTTTTTTSTQVIPAAPVKRHTAAPSTAASGMWK